jgi:rod shape-determining protein MreD
MGYHRLNTILVLLVAFLVVFLQSICTGFRDLVGAQPDLLPGLVVYVSLSCGISDLVLLCLAGGLWVDSLSTNPLGVTVLPLFLIGFGLRRYRGLLARDQVNAQWMLGAGAHAIAPLLTLVLLWSMNQNPLIGWFSLWQWFVVTLLGAAATPLWFRLFDRMSNALSYQQEELPSFRPDREIKRGRS